MRIMHEGSGGRDVPYFRISVDGKDSFTAVGILSSDKALTHIDMSDDYFNQFTMKIEWENNNM